MPRKEPDAVVSYFKSREETEKAIRDQFKQNEYIKRKIQQIILMFVCASVAIQLTIANVIVFIVVFRITNGNLKECVVSAFPDLASFLKYYIAATFVELITILSFLTRATFSNSVLEFFKINRGRKSIKAKTSKRK